MRMTNSSFNYFSLVSVLMAMFAFCGSAFAVTDVEVYASSKRGGGVSVGSLDASGAVIDEKTVLVGQGATVQKGQPVSQPFALSAQKMKTGLSKVKELNDTVVRDDANAKLDDLKRRITTS